jgi:hypothetical protein
VISSRSSFSDFDAHTANINATNQTSTKKPSQKIDSNLKQITLEMQINNMIEQEFTHSRIPIDNGSSHRKSRITALLNKPMHQSSARTTESAENNSSVAKKIKLEDNGPQMDQIADDQFSPPPSRSRSGSITKKILKGLSVEDQFRQSSSRLNENLTPQPESPSSSRSKKHKEEKILILNRTPSPISSPSHSLHETHGRHQLESGSIIARPRKNSMTMKLLTNDNQQSKCKFFH